MSGRTRITETRAWLLDIPLKQPYSVAYESYESVKNIIVRLSAGGTEGWGCAAPDEHVTGETISAAAAAIKDVLAPALLETGESDFGILVHIVNQVAPAAPAARASFDIALHDIIGKIRRAPLVEILGRSRNSIPTSVTIGISGVEETLADAEKRINEGFTTLKVKGGADPDEDIIRIKSLRGRFPAAALWLDANQGYSEKDAAKVAAALAGIIEFIEQPVAAEDIDSLSKLTKECPVPIMADESVITPEDAARALRAGIKLINVKLMKAGGISEAIRICDAAGKAGAGVMIGCMDELPVSMAAAAHLALSHPAVRHADLDGHLDLEQNIVSGGIIIKDGSVSVSAAPGLGVTIYAKQLGKNAALL